MGIRSDLCHSHSIACRLVTKPCEILFAPSTPRIYKSCTLLEPEGEEGSLTFVSQPNNAYQRLFLVVIIILCILYFQLTYYIIWTLSLGWFFVHLSLVLQL